MVPILGISYGELALIIGVTAAVLGPKDIPVIARAAGRISGKAVGFLLNARKQLDLFGERTQINELHRELQDTMAQLEAIRYEIRSGVNIVNPGPLARRAYRAAEGFGQSDSPPPPPQQQQRVPGVVPTAAAPREPWAGISSLTPATSASARAFAEAAQASRASADPAEPPIAPAATEAPGAPDERAGVAPADYDLESSSADGPRPRYSSYGQDGARVGVVEPLPVSAVSAGLIPRRTDSLPGGADILSDSIVERQVAEQASGFLHRFAPRGAAGALREGR